MSLVFTLVYTLNGVKYEVTGYTTEDYFWLKAYDVNVLFNTFLHIDHKIYKKYGRQWKNLCF